VLDLAPAPQRQRQRHGARTPAGIRQLQAPSRPHRRRRRSTRVRAKVHPRADRQLHPDGRRAGASRIGDELVRRHERAKTRIGAGVGVRGRDVVAACVRLGKRPSPRSVPTSRLLRTNSDHVVGSRGVTALGRKRERRTTGHGRDPDACFSAKRSRAGDSAARGGDLGAGGWGSARASTRRHVPGRCAVESPRTVAFRFGPLAAKCQLASAEVAMLTRTVSSGLLNVARRGASAETV
jgi:hypothetical protein